jgi:hypothetical protein
MGGEAANCWGEKARDKAALFCSVKFCLYRG